MHAESDLVDLYTKSVLDLSMTEQKLKDAEHNLQVVSQIAFRAGFEEAKHRLINYLHEYNAERCRMYEDDVQMHRQFSSRADQLKRNRTDVDIIRNAEAMKVTKHIAWVLNNMSVEG